MIGFGQLRAERLDKGLLQLLVHLKGEFQGVLFHLSRILGLLSDFAGACLHAALGRFPQGYGHRLGRLVDQRRNTGYMLLGALTLASLHHFE